PAFEGSSKGVHGDSRVYTWDDLHQRAKHLLQVYKQPALVEEFIPGAEVTVGVIGNDPPRVVGVMQVVPQQGLDDTFMYTLEVKRNWRQMVFYHCPPQLPAACVQEIENAAITLFRALGCRDVARLDFRIDGNGCVYFLEANPLPGLGDYSDLPIMTALAGWDYSRLLETILNSALERYGLLLPRHAYSTSL
ncbi:MAG: D-alanine--D-alanine ligase, partial [Dehalococcoidia bacterium]|nr:D-alanine--D-alanine ligase [Dehalococcoidia bacterium]